MAYGEFHQGYQKCKQPSNDALSEDAPDTLSSDRVQLKKLQHEVDYLKQEIEFLKNFHDQKYAEVGALLMNESSCVFEIIQNTIQSIK